MTVSVDADSTFPHPYSITVDHCYLVKVFTSPNHVIDKIEISLEMPEYWKYVPIGSCGINSKRIEIRMCDEEILKEVCVLFQSLESIGSFFGIKKISWESPSREWIPENEEDKQSLRYSLYSLQKTSREKTYLSEMGPSVIGSILANRERNKSLVLPMSFYREAYNNFKSERYVDAFRGFYFFLEDLYGKGNTSNKKVAKSWKQSSMLIDAIKHALNELQGFDDENIVEIQRFLEMEI